MQCEQGFRSYNEVRSVYDYGHYEKSVEQDQLEQEQGTKIIELREKIPALIKELQEGEFEDAEEKLQFEALIVELK